MISQGVWLFVVLGAGLLPAQVTSRLEEIRTAREEKARLLEPETTSTTERALLAVRERRLIERFTAGVAGFRVKFGGLVSGSGFALGPEYLRRDLRGGNVVFRASAQASFKAFQLYEVQLTLPKLYSERLYVDLRSNHRNYPRMDYYGPGPDSEETGRSNFSLEDTSFELISAVRPQRHLSVGGTVGFLMVNVGPGRDPRFVSSDAIFGPAGTAGIDRQSDFLRSSAFAQYDYRDNPGGPRNGGKYLARFSWISDRGIALHSFRQLDLEVQQYIPFFNRRRVIALRGKSVLTDTSPGQRVPFYLQPTVGGSEDLRGFRQFRFYGDNMLALNAEYRWESFSGLDMVLFADGGKVFQRHAQWNLKDLESSVGFGFRFNVRNNVFLRIDVGFSHEGYQVWAKFNNVF